MKYYVVSDVHGYCTYLKKALEDAGFFDETQPSVLVVCGDLLDRGREAKQTVEFMLKLLQEDRLVYILGNHEDLLVECLQEIACGKAYEIALGMSHHYSNRTWDTLLQLSEMNEIEACQNPNELIRRVRSSPFYTKLLPEGVDYYETPNYIFTHGWIPCSAQGFRPNIKYKYDAEWRDADVVDWHRARWFNGMELACKHHIIEPDKTVVCGHWNTSYGHSHIHHSCSEWGEDADFSPFREEGILAIDASASNSGRINCVVIED